MCEVLVFGGTAEGREVAEALRAGNIPARAYVATEYGETLIPASATLEVHAGRMDAAAMEEAMRESACRLVIDATHPYAVEVTENIRAAAAAAGRTCLRVLRGREEAGDARFVEDTAAAVDYLNTIEGNIFLSTGSKELAAFTKVRDYQERVFARVLSLPEVVESCAALGFLGKNLFAMQGPFTKEVNTALLRQTKARVLVTKDTGREGGFAEKADAAKEADCELLVIGRPTEEEGMSLDECLAYLRNEYPSIPAAPEGAGEETSGRRGITLVGIGMGDPEGRTLTSEAARALAEADLLIGAQRCLAAVDARGRATLAEYRAEAIRDYIEANPAYQKVAVLLSGDVGFYSGAKKLRELLPEAKVICGISSLVCFAARVGLSWDDARMVSAHGKTAHLVSEIRRHPKVFALLSKAEDLASVCDSLLAFGMDEVELFYGADLGYENEQILRGRPAELRNETGADLTVLFARNPAPDRQIGPGLPDEAFLREKVPMTKEEVRAISIAKLRLTEGFVLWDVGAGTGSVSVEAARLDPTSTVWAVEKKGEAAELLEKNRRLFCLDNMEIIAGCAPAALAELPAPTHVFVGGSSGNLREILRAALEKNPRARVVINAITLETVTAALRAAEELGLSEVDVTSVTVAKSREVGESHMMTGQNPVYVIAANGVKEEAE